MAISISEKQHWKERIEKKIKQRIHALKSQNPTYFVNAESEAKLLAINELGIATEFEELKHLNQEIDRMTEDLKTRICVTIEKLSGEKPLHYNVHVGRIDTLLQPYTARKLDELLQADKLGREVAKLESEKENLMDTIWLATSSRQMSDMWTKVLKLLDEEGTDFQREILATPKPSE